MNRTIIDGGEDVWFTKERGEAFGEGGGCVEGRSSGSISYVEVEEKEKKKWWERILELTHILEFLYFDESYVIYAV